jgi:phage terminase small subunit
VREYLVDLNGTQAAIRAGYSPATADVQASQLLRFPKVAAAVSEALAARQRRCDVTADRVLLELARIAYADVRLLFDANGQLRAPRDLDPAIAPAIASIEVVTKSLGDGEVEYVHKIRLAPKVDALKTLAQHLGLLRMKVDVEAADALPIRIVHQHIEG